MNKIKKKLILIVLAIIIFQYGCTSIKQVIDEKKLKNEDKPGIIYVFTKDSILYCLNKYEIIGDSILSGSGFKKNNEAEASFEGNIPYYNIKYILVKEGDFWKTALAVGIIGYIGISCVSNLSEKNFSVWSDIKYPTGNLTGSCPFIYSWGGDRYILEGEAFGIGLSKSLEMKTSHILNSLIANDSISKIKLSNERPETHYFNKVEVKATEIDKKAEVYADVNNQFWQVEKMITPFIAKDISGNNITQRIINKDNDYWESDVANINVNDDFEDVIELEFIKDKSVKDGALLINAINTNLSQMVFEFMGGYLGDQVLEFYNSLETDTELMSIFRNWIKDVSLKAYVWNKNKWEEKGFIYPEANSIPFSKIISIHFEDINQDTIKLMLKSLTDVWKIDEIQLGLDSKPVEKIIDIPIITAKDNNKDVIELLQDSDDKYKMLLPSENIELSFKPVIPSKDKKIIYALNLQGYLYEWLDDKIASYGFQFVNINRADKINYLKNMLRYKSVFLPPIYSAWKKVK